MLSLFNGRESNEKKVKSKRGAKTKKLQVVQQPMRREKQRKKYREKQKT